MPYVFKRSLPAEILAFINDTKRTYNTEIGFHIRLSDASEIYLGTHTFTMDKLTQPNQTVASITPVNFTGKIASASEFKHSQSKAPDYGAAELVNLDYTYTQLVADAQRLYEGAQVTAYLCFPRADGNYTGVIYFIGLVREIQGDDESASMTVIHQLSSRAATMGKEITQRCTNELGDAWCGVPVGTLSLPDDTCSKVYSDKANGCLKWGGIFNGVPFINPNGIIANYSGTIGGGGWGGGDGQNCPDVDSWFYALDGWIHGSELRDGVILKTHHDQPVTVTGVERVRADYRYLVKCNRTGVEVIVSATHKFLRSADDLKGKACVSWDFNDDLVLVTPQGVQLSYGRQNFKANFALGEDYSITPYTGGDVLKLSTSAPHLYVAGRSKGAGFASHNTKGGGWTPIEL